MNACTLPVPAILRGGAEVDAVQYSKYMSPAWQATAETSRGGRGPGQRAVSPEDFPATAR